MESRLEYTSNDTILAINLGVNVRTDHFPSSINNLIIEYAFGSINNFFKYKKLYSEPFSKFCWIYHLMSNHLTPESTMIILKCAARYNNYSIIQSYHNYLHMSANNAFTNKLFDIAWKHSSQDVMVSLLEQYSNILIQSSLPHLFINACIQGKIRVAERLEHRYNLINGDHSEVIANKVFDLIAQKGDLELLSWLFGVKTNPKNEILVIICRAYQYGHVNILNWLKNDIKLTDKEWNRSLNHYHYITIASNIPNEWIEKYNSARKNKNCIIQ